MSQGEELLALHLKAKGIEFVREVRFAPPRRWRLDFVLPRKAPSKPGCEGIKDARNYDLAIEVEGGHWLGGHGGKRFRADCEKYNEATILGYRLLRFTTDMVEDGTALKTIERMVGHEKEA